MYINVKCWYVQIATYKVVLLNKDMWYKHVSNMLSEMLHMLEYYPKALSPVD